MLKLDPRDFSNHSYKGLEKIQAKIDELYKKNPSEYKKKASAAVQSLPSYISAWGLHRLAGDGLKYKNGSKETKYKGFVYQQFLQTLQELSKIDDSLNNPKILINIDLPSYAGLNRLAIVLAQEWAFWSTAILGEPKE